MAEMPCGECKIGVYTERSFFNKYARQFGALDVVHRANAIPHCKRLDRPCQGATEFHEWLVMIDNEDLKVNLPFERVPQHAADPGFGPVPPAPPSNVHPINNIPCCGDFTKCLRTCTPRAERERTKAMTASKAGETFDIQDARQQIAEQRELWLAERGRVIKLMAELAAANARAAEAELTATAWEQNYEASVMERIELQDKLSAAELDAGRYRQTRTMPFVLDTSRITPLRPDKFDQLIDAALRRSAP